MSKFGVRKSAQGVIAVAAAGILTLTGCQNGEDQGGTGTAGPSTAPSSTESGAPSAQPTQSSQPTTAAPGGAAGGTAKAGQTLKLGEAAQFPFKYGTSTNGTIELTVTAIEQGKPEDLAPLKLGDKASGKVPYYIRYTVKNVGDTDLSYATVGHIKGHLGDGTDAQDLMIIGKFEKCDKSSLPKGFVKGQTQTSCAVALAPSATTKVASAEYWGDPFTLGKGLTWK
ncbi:hypothetical protein [Streptomyces bambusae]|uniref:Lipoprotein n=1 Tax=Streptomyces bambusae TaxID=1550616 RepID=A0ABS6ZEB4_9ACTN|nr:hypothetical protein [Streptomyces bambusae]MBW5486068.1 hypothetical protein [Streptomyces bambusae]